MTVELHNFPIGPHVDFAKSTQISTEFFDWDKIVSRKSLIPADGISHISEWHEFSQMGQGQRSFATFCCNHYKGGLCFGRDSLLPNIKTPELLTKALSIVDENGNLPRPKVVLGFIECLKMIEELMIDAYNRMTGVIDSK